MKPVINMQKAIIHPLLLPCCMAMSFNLYAMKTSDIVQVDVTGEIVAPSCTADVTQTVDLGNAIASEISVPGGNGKATALKLTLTQCSPELNQVTATFSGSPYSEDAAYAKDIYANGISTGAHDIGLQLFNLDGKPLVNLANGVSYPFQVNAATASAELPIAARLYTPHGQPTAGAFSAAVTVSFTYQ